MGLIDSNPSEYLPRDIASGSLSVIDSVHARIHAGKSFSASHAVSVGTGTAVTVLITAPASGSYHLDYAIEATNSGTWTFSKAPNASGGTAIVGYNRNVGSSTVSALTHTHTATYTSAGTILENHCIGTSGQGNSSGGGSGQSRHEWELNPGELYLLRFVALNAATNVAVNLSYYIEG